MRDHHVAQADREGRLTVTESPGRLLGLKSEDRVIFEIDERGGAAVIQPVRAASIAELRGAAGNLPSPLAWDEGRRIAREDALMTERLGES